MTIILHVWLWVFTAHHSTDSFPCTSAKWCTVAVDTYSLEFVP